MIANQIWMHGDLLIEVKIPMSTYNNAGCFALFSESPNGVACYSLKDLMTFFLKSHGWHYIGDL